MKQQQKVLVILIALLIAAVVYVYAIKGRTTFSQEEDSSDDETKYHPDLSTVPRAKSVVKATEIILPNNSNTIFPIKKGDSGKAVKLLQLSLGVPADGIFGDITLHALQNSELQTDNVTEEVYGKISMPDVSTNGFPLMRGTQNSWVKGLQIALDLTADGIFGPKTEQSVKKFLGGSVIVTKDDYIRMLNTKLNLNYNLL